LKSLSILAYNSTSSQYPLFSVMHAGSSRG